LDWPESQEAILADIGSVTAGKRRDFCRLLSAGGWAIAADSACVSAGKTRAFCRLRR
jgi:hypothetical protein